MIPITLHKEIHAQSAPSMANIPFFSPGIHNPVNLSIPSNASSGLGMTISGAIPQGGSQNGGLASLFSQPIQTSTPMPPLSVVAPMSAATTLTATSATPDWSKLPVMKDKPNCDFYRSLEEARRCGLSGLDAYPINYGLKYCERFSGLDNMLSPEGVAWRDKTMRCLQQTLKDYLLEHPNATCSELATTAFNSHPECYTTDFDGPSICSLFVPGKAHNVFKIAATVDASDAIQVRSVVQALATLMLCARMYGERLLTDLLRELEGIQ